MAAISGAMLSIYSCGESKEDKDTEVIHVDSTDVQRQERAAAIFQTLPQPEDPGTPIARLGKKLYYEKALSINRELSCNSCHMLDKHGVDNLPTSPGHEGKTGDRNSPTVYNAALHFAQFWDGRAANLTEQAKGPILNPIEMGLPDEKTAEKRIQEIPEYTALFAEAFPDQKNPITYDNIAGSIAAFEKCLIIPSPFDRYLAGNLDAISPEEKKGLDLFMDKNCISCHMGPAVGGMIYQKFGLVNGPYWDFTNSTNHDKGRAMVTNNEMDAYFFKVPSLRNVAMTAPYFHDGSVTDLKEAVKIMGQTQLGQVLKPDEVDAIVSFLGALTGVAPAFALEDNTHNTK